MRTMTYVLLNNINKFKYVDNIPVLHLNLQGVFHIHSFRARARVRARARMLLEGLLDKIPKNGYFDQVEQENEEGSQNCVLQILSFWGA
jgi:hypothetical protein